MFAKHSLRASPTDSLKWRIKIQNLQKRIIFNSNNFSIFGDYNINYIIKIFHTFNKISFLFPKHLISRFLITGNIIKIYTFISHSNIFGEFSKFGEFHTHTHTPTFSIFENLLEHKTCSKSPKSPF